MCIRDRVRITRNTSFCVSFSTSGKTSEQRSWAFSSSMPQSRVQLPKLPTTLALGAGVPGGGATFLAALEPPDCAKAVPAARSPNAAANASPSPSPRPRLRPRSPTSPAALNPATCSSFTRTRRHTNRPAGTTWRQITANHSLWQRACQPVCAAYKCFAATRPRARPPMPKKISVGSDNEAAPTIGLVSLGCPKALVDSERIITRLRAEGYELSPDYEGADAVVVNTCGFLNSAKAESLQAIGEALAENGKVIVTGCLGVEADRIRAQYPDVLAITGP